MAQEKIPGSVKKWKIPGNKCIAMVSKKNSKKITKSDIDNWDV